MDQELSVDDIWNDNWIIPKSRIEDTLVEYATIEESGERNEESSEQRVATDPNQYGQVL